MNHITEEADLYALGLLEADERAEIDDHVSICDPCARRLARAEATVTTMVDATIALESAPPALDARIARFESRPRSAVFIRKTRGQMVMQLGRGVGRIQRGAHCGI